MNFIIYLFFFFFQAEDGIRDGTVTGVQTCALPISGRRRPVRGAPSAGETLYQARQPMVRLGPASAVLPPGGFLQAVPEAEIGRASCRERVWVAVEDAEVKMKRI